MVNLQPHLPAAPAAERDGDTEERILAAAHAVFLRHGTHGARMQDIADEAGVNKALLHYYFRSKDRLAERVFRRTFAEVVPQVLAALASELDLAAKVQRVVHLYIEALSASPFLPGYLLCEMNQHPERLRETVAALAPVPLAEVGDRVLGTIRRQLDEGARAGTLRPTSAEHFVVNLFSLCVFPFAARPMLGIVLGMGDEQFAEFVGAREREVTRFFLDALRP